MKKWKILEETDVSPSKWFPIKQHKIELPNGKVIDDYYIATLNNVGMILPITANNEIVLVKQYKHGMNDILIELPAGFQQQNKSIEESAIAELEEETGIKIPIGKLIPMGKIANAPTKSTHITYGFLAKDVEFNSVQNLEETEEIEIVRRSPSETIEMIKKGEIWVGDSVGLIMKTYLMFPELFI